MRTLPLLLSAGLLACGGAPKATKPRPAPNFVADFAAARAQPQAQITYAIFATDPVPTNTQRAARRALAQVASALRSPSADLAAAAKRAGTLPTFTLNFVDPSELPLNLAVLVQAAGAHGSALTAAGSVLLLRYQGPARRDDGQVFAAAVAAATLAKGEARVVVDLQTLTAHDRAGFIAGLARPDWLADQARVEVVRTDDETVMLLTRGMARFALPDLEMADVDLPEARAEFTRFQETFNALRVGGQAWLEGPEGATLGACSRPTEAFDLACKSVPRSQK
jgi:hypothetical protein